MLTCEKSDSYWLQQFNAKHHCALTLGKYIGGGLTGSVYEVNQPKFHPMNWISGYPSDSMVMKIMHTDVTWDNHGKPQEVESRKEREDWETHFRHEIEMMQDLEDCPYTMPLYDHHCFVEDQKEVRMVFLLLMPRMETLDAYWENREKKLEEGDLIQLSRDISAALAECHRQEILHRDIKPQNIYVQILPGGAHRYILADFGCSRSFIKKPGKGLTGVGNPFSDPRIQDFKVGLRDYTPDVYQMGRMLCYLITEKECGLMDPDKLGMLKSEFADFILKAANTNYHLRYQNGSEMVEALQKVDAKSGTQIVYNRNYRAAKRALSKGNYAEARRFAIVGMQNGESSCDVVELYCRLRAYMQKPSAREREQLFRDAQDLYLEKEHSAALCFAAILHQMDGNRQEAMEQMRDSAREGFIPAMYLYGRMLCDTAASGSKAQREGLNQIIRSAELGYWDALHYLQNYAPLEDLPMGLQRLVLQAKLDALDDPVGAGIRNLRNAIASCL